MKKYLIILNGCDDQTECEIELTDEEIFLFIEIAKEIKSHYFIDVINILEGAKYERY